MQSDFSDLAALRRTCERERPRFHRPELRRALAALRDLLDNPDHTERAFEVGYALDGDTSQRDLARMFECPAGRELFRERPRLVDLLCDREALGGLPEGSFGRAYLDHIERYGLDPAKLMQLRRDTDPLHAERDENMRWFVERSEVIHDLWHVLTGYGADGLGEGALLAFSLAQGYSRSGALLTLGASTRIVQMVGPRWLGYVWRAFRRGRAAVCLASLPYEQLLPLPLELVRRAVGIEDPNRAHRGGVLQEPTGELARAA